MGKVKWKWKNAPGGRAEIENDKYAKSDIFTFNSGGAFKLLLHFSYLWNIAQKSIIQIFDTLNINKFHWNFAPRKSGIHNGGPIVYC